MFAAGARLRLRQRYLQQTMYFSNIEYPETISPVSSAEAYNDLYKRATSKELFDFTISLRRELHANPELMYNEIETSALIAETLKDLGVRHTKGWGKNTRQSFWPGPGGTGIVAEIGSGAPCVALRADMDALPILEETPVPFVSKNEGVMHACGHDGHTAMLLGAARLLRDLENEGRKPNGTVRLIFQPAEEGGAGAKRMCEEGVLSKEPPVERAFGFHLWPTLRSGEIGGRPGTVMAASDTFDFIVRGKGGHAAMPHLTHDPVVCAANMIGSLQTLTSRRTSPLDAAVVSVTKLESDADAYNVIPEIVRIGGTIRALTEEHLLSIRSGLKRMAESMADAHGCGAEDFQFRPDYYPPTVNDEQLWFNFVEKTVPAAITGPHSTISKVDPCMGAEDFSFYASEVPSAFLFIGQGGSCNENGEQLKTSFSLHHPCFAIDEKVLATGVALHAHLATSALIDLMR